MKRSLFLAIAAAVVLSGCALKPEGDLTGDVAKRTVHLDAAGNATFTLEAKLDVPANRLSLLREVRAHVDYARAPAATTNGTFQFRCDIVLTNGATTLGTVGWSGGVGGELPAGEADRTLPTSALRSDLHLRAKAACTVTTLAPGSDAVDLLLGPIHLATFA
jgi:hypothetical protein